MTTERLESILKENGIYIEDFISSSGYNATIKVMTQAVLHKIIAANGSVLPKKRN